MADLGTDVLSQESAETKTQGKLLGVVKTVGYLQKMRTNTVVLGFSCFDVGLS